MNREPAMETGVQEGPAVVAAPLADLDERISQQLIARGRLKETDLARARRVHEENPEDSLVALMTRIGLVSERDAAEAASEVLRRVLGRAEVAARDYRATKACLSTWDGRGQPGRDNETTGDRDDRLHPLPR